jgi:hypothetical protein
MRSVLARETFKLVLCSPMQWARETRELAGLGDKAVLFTSNWWSGIMANTRV